MCRCSAAAPEVWNESCSIRVGCNFRTTPDRALADAKGHPHHLEQKLLVLVPARIPAVQARRPRLRRGGGVARRSLDSRRALAALALVPGAVAHARRGQSLGYTGDRRIPGRGLSQG